MGLLIGPDAVTPTTHELELRETSIIGGRPWAICHRQAESKITLKGR
jgi:hypothetical protein